jgi:hypothetical protein
MPEEIIALAGVIAVFSVPLVWVLTTHQRKMAEIIHRTRENQLNANNDTVSQEVRELRQMVFQQAIALDNLTSEIKKTQLQASQSENLSTRLKQE